MIRVQEKVPKRQHNRKRIKHMPIFYNHGECNLLLFYMYVNFLFHCIFMFIDSLSSQLRAETYV